MPSYVPLNTAIDRLRHAQRVLVIGCSGGGKTTLALGIAEAFDLAYQSMDRDVRWLPGWQMRDRQEQRAIIDRLVRKDRWVMDGSGPSSFDLRVPRADLILWVRVPRMTALMGVAGRVLRNYGQVREGMADGCPEPMPDRAFLSYIWTFEQRFAPRIIEQIDKHGPEVPVFVIRSRRESARLLEQERA